MHCWASLNSHLENSFAFTPLVQVLEIILHFIVLMYFILHRKIVSTFFLLLHSLKMSDN